MEKENLIEFYKTHIEKSYAAAENGKSKITQKIMAMDGMSGTKTRHFYNNMLDFPDARYLEIGTWKGSSVCSAMCGNSAKVVCIDNWSEFGGPKDAFLQNFAEFKGANTATFVEYDCFTLDVNVLPKHGFNIYMYDGNHSSDSHYNALVHYYNCLDDIFIFIVDDWNWGSVREATMRAIKDVGLTILYEKAIRLTDDDTHTPHEIAVRSWWNGIYIALLQKPIS